MCNYPIVYPERRTIPAKTIRAWYEDAVANGELEDKGLTDIDLMARALHDLGWITMTREGEKS